MKSAALLRLGFIYDWWLKCDQLPVHKLCNSLSANQIALHSSMHFYSSGPFY